MSLNIKSSGSYKMSTFMEIVENLELQFNAKGAITVKGARSDKDGKMVMDADFELEAIRALLELSNDILKQKIITTSDDSITLNLSGKMTATYTIASYSSVKKYN